MASPDRFKLVTTSEVNEIINNAVPENTKKATKFAVKIFNEWFSQQTEFSTQLEEMEKAELSKCLEKFYLGARQKDGFFYKANTLRSIRAGLDRYLQSPDLKKPFSIITDPEFFQANKALDAFVKTLRKSGEIAEVVHKGSLTPEIVEKLFQSGQLGPADSKDPSQLQNTVWFYISIYFGKRGRFSLGENQRKMTKHMLALRTTLSGRRFFEINRGVAGALMANSITHQGVVKSVEEEWSSAKMFECPGSPRCPVETVKNYLLHLHPGAEFFFQKPRAVSGAKFNPALDQIWYCNAPLGDRSLGEMMKKLTSRAGIFPYLTNYCIRATNVDVLGYENVEACHSRPLTLSIAEAAESVSMDESESDKCTSSLSNTWMPESLDLFKKLTSGLIDHGKGDWIKYTDDLSSSSFNGEKKLFTKAVNSEFPGKFFEYQYFVNKDKRKLKGVVQFGPYTQGTPGCVHRGASTCILDDAINACVNRCFSHCITASLSMEYKSFLPLGSTTLVESRVDKVEGKIIFCSAELKSPDGKVTFVTASALFIQLDTQGKVHNLGIGSAATARKAMEEEIIGGKGTMSKHGSGNSSSSVRVEQNAQTRVLNSCNDQISSDDGFSGNSRTDTTERKMRVRSTLLQQLKDLKALKDDGVLLESEFVSQKEKLLRELNSL